MQSQLIILKKVVDNDKKLIKHCVDKAKSSLFIQLLYVTTVLQITNISCAIVEYMGGWEWRYNSTYA
jgi:hypothetical protein